MSAIKTPSERGVQQSRSIKKTRSSKCRVKRTSSGGYGCAKVYSRKEIAEIATECGIDLKRGPTHKSPGTLKNVDELCTEIIELIRDDPVERFINKGNAIIQEITTTFEDNRTLSTTYSRVFGEFPILDIRDIMTHVATHYEDLENGDRQLDTTIGEFRQKLHMTMEILALSANINSLLDREIALFDPHGSIANRLRELSSRINSLNNHNLTLMDNYLREYNDLKAEIQRMGRRCVNQRSPVEDEDVNEIAEEDLIRLSNGACWDIDTLINYIKTTANGQNTIKKIKQYMPSYPSEERLWLTDADYKKITRHPKAKAVKLNQFIKDREYSRYADRISDMTMDTLYNMGSLLWSRGPPFVAAINQRMTPDQLAVWNRVVGGMMRWDLPDEILAARQGTIEHDIQYLINGIIKTQAINQLHRYYQNLTHDEKEALNTVTPRLGEDIIQCNVGEHCVMQMGEKLVDTYNKMANSKGRERVNWKNVMRN